MKTIRRSIFNRLYRQADEAEKLGLKSVATNLTNVLEKTASNLRDDDSFYSYSSDEFSDEVNQIMWDAAMRVVDFYDIKQVKAEVVDSLISKFANDLKKEICSAHGKIHAVGAFEPTVPGEVKEHTVFEISEEEEDE